MPAFIGGIVIFQIAGTGSAIFGDAPLITPKTITKTFAGAGSGNTGVLSNTNSFWSSTNTLDPDVFDENQVTPGPGLFAPVLPGAVPVPTPVGGRPRPAAAPIRISGGSVQAIPAANPAMRNSRNQTSGLLRNRKQTDQQKRRRKINQV